ncbi:hypothetical protein [Subtercola sp. RTI3]|uniref:hypothetical protein n=1 Tax=Subtercola sp. RTI3 TaxID=3048639 RepID=UPI002B22AA60|nr:hypothetical protein [Subtercola sp. RTI3]MEA9983680.1 hypothetical protein [Subtercola sp. RTI3]
MTDTTEDTPLQGVDFEPPKALVFEEFLKESLSAALIYEDRMKLPEFGATDASKTHADAQAIYADYFRDLHAFLWHATTAHFLIRMQENVPRVAEAIAAEVKSWLEYGDLYQEWIWDWARERGMDPEKIRSEARMEHQAWLAEPAGQRRKKQEEAEHTAPAE